MRFDGIGRHALAWLGLSLLVGCGATPAPTPAAGGAYHVQQRYDPFDRYTPPPSRGDYLSTPCRVYHPYRLKCERTSIGRVVCRRVCLQWW